MGTILKFIGGDAFRWIVCFVAVGVSVYFVSFLQDRKIERLEADLESANAKAAYMQTLSKVNCFEEKQKIIFKRIGSEKRDINSSVGEHTLDF